MNEASRWRLAIAQRVASAYTTNPKVRAVLVGGSVARGWADPYSDLEMGLFWDPLPTPAELTAAREQSRGTEGKLAAFDAERQDVWPEEYAVGGLPLDLRHMLVARMGEVLTAVQDQGDLSMERQMIIAAVQHGVPLQGAPLIESWQARAALYPDSLARAMIARHASLPAWSYVPMLVERGDLPLVYTAFQQATWRVLGMLLGLNRLYHPGMKRVDRHVAALEVAPPDLSGRLKQMFRSEPLVGAHLMRELIEETFALVELHAPEVDIREARQQFRYERPVLHTAPDALMA
jgi:hypothetical protein